MFFLHVKLTKFNWKDFDSCKILKMVACALLNTRKQAQKSKSSMLKL